MGLGTAATSIRGLGGCGLSLEGAAEVKGVQEARTPFGATENGLADNRWAVFSKKVLKPARTAEFRGQVETRGRWETIQGAAALSRVTEIHHGE
ncbi:hypothetical protein GCM10009828_005230 [Actinoplanes couchii]|uniref:Uncharacterized protein n=1 Tax=Actinoplanes couchii TaxID=403638 RepID=A0ABQ3XID6_9ACTN|nr:hypothetical protein Aco03nite_066600 [Actinoplanes couchii]